MQQHEKTPIHEHRFTYPVVTALPPRSAQSEERAVQAEAGSGSRMPSGSVVVLPHLRVQFKDAR